MPRSTRKYGNVKSVLDGITFDSNAERDRYLELRNLARTGVIYALEVHPRYQLEPGFRDPRGKKWPAVHYSPDFHYVIGGQMIAEDVKGVETAVFRLKWRIAVARYPATEFRIIKA